MSKGNYRSSLLALVLILLALLAQPATGSDTNLVQANHPISAEIEFSLTGVATGWLRSGSRIFRTEINGVDWQDVTPDLKQNESLLDVYFLDSIRCCDPYSEHKWRGMAAEPAKNNRCRRDLAGSADHSSKSES